jgi:hypothetical protein
MDVSNSTGQDTQYRVANGGAKAQATNWQPLLRQSHHQCSDPTTAFTIEFRLDDGTLVSHSFNHPKAAVELVKDGNNYKIKGIRTAA